MNQPAFDPNIPAGAHYVITPGHHRRSMKVKLKAILKEHHSALRDAHTAEEQEHQHELLATAILDEWP